MKLKHPLLHRLLQILPALIRALAEIVKRTPKF